MGVFVKYINSYLPGPPVSNQTLESRIVVTGRRISQGMLQKTMGSGYRHFAEKEEQVSDLAVKAAQPVLKDYNKPVELLIFAAACADLIEPATCNIIQQKLGLRCPAFDVKNACNSVLSAMEIAKAMMQAQGYKNVLIVSGEKPSDSIRYCFEKSELLKDHFAAFSFGDAGIALLLERDESDHGIFYQKSISYGEHWSLCTIPGGGSMYPNDADKLFFSGQTYALKNEVKRLAAPFVMKCLAEAGVKLFKHNAKLPLHLAYFLVQDRLASKNI